MRSVDKRYFSIHNTTHYVWTLTDGMRGSCYFWDQYKR